jgi:phosphatidylglycerol lysyltransferase
LAQLERLRRVFPIEVIRLSRFATLLMGLALVVCSLNIAKRKRRAWIWTLTLSGFSTAFQVLRGGARGEALLSAALFAVLCLTRRSFTVRSRTVDWNDSFLKLGVALLSLLAYGIAGFLLLSKADFGIEFGMRDAMVWTVRLIIFSSEPSLIPRTRHAEWFLNSISLLSFAVIAYSLYSLFRPALYRLRTHPAEVEKARADHGRTW